MNQRNAGVKVLCLTAWRYPIINCPGGDRTHNIQIRDTYKGCDLQGTKEICCQCYTPHHQELLLDGWYVGDKNGFLTDDSYYALLQTGIRVPVNKEVYEEWQKGWADEPTTDDDKVYELGEDYEEKESILAFEICR